MFYSIIITVILYGQTHEYVADYNLTKEDCISAIEQSSENVACYEQPEFIKD